MDRARVDELLGKLPRSRQPSRDLWPGIERSLGGAPVRLPRQKLFESRLSRIALAAACVAVTVVVTGIVVLRITPPADRRQPDYVRVLGIASVDDPAVTLLLERLMEAEREYHLAQEELVASLTHIAFALGGDAAARELAARVSAGNPIGDELMTAVREDPSQSESIRNLAVFYGTQARSLQRTTRFVKDLGK